MPTLPQISTPALLAIDVGSSSLRCQLYTPNGEVLGGMEARRVYEFQVSAEGGVEVEAEQLFGLLTECLDEILEKAGPLGSTIAGVALCTFWHNLVGLDAEGKPLIPVLTWADTRSLAAVKQLQERLDPASTHQRTGCMFHTSYLPAKFLWLQQTRPEAFRRAAWWGSLGEYFLLKLFHQPLCSISMASGTGLLDQRLCQWDAEMLEFLQLDASRLSPLGDFDTPLKGLPEPYASRWPALGSVPWFPAIGDGASSNIGCGCTGPDRVAVMVGTSGALRVVFPSREYHLPAGLWCYRVDRKRMVMGGALSNGGNLFQWLTETLRLPEDPGRLEKDLSTLSPGAHGIAVLPFLAGERSTGWNPQARAVLAGLSLHTRPIDILQAGLEAVAYRFSSILELLAPSLPASFEIVATGGALLQSPSWVKILADVLGRTVTLAEAPEASSRGVALLAAEALGLIPSLEKIAPVPGPLFLPRMENYRIHRDLSRRQEELYGWMYGGNEKRN
jgi:gluconokinase